MRHGPYDRQCHRDVGVPIDKVTDRWSKFDRNALVARREAPKPDAFKNVFEKNDEAQLGLSTPETQVLRVALPTRDSPNPLGHHRTIGIVLLKGPRRGVFLMSEVPLKAASLGFRAAQCIISPVVSSGNGMR